ncbi:Protein of unknown function (DUF1843) [Caulobacter sp. AP07]|uniref:DUF1843 domain-containing protein n=1 Tax=Caulobacter sp. AP07 TaxID=1144304 RepID=UPI000272169C|nr:DUF1843 domain-containing protein [Caulobacter sp. AP07]EJL25069.1 Protein of unknown function (DUF1843) [Caulobacter sp. AP07]
MAMVLYGSAITDGIAKGDLTELQRLQAQAEAHVTEYGDIPTLLTALKVEIAKLEGGAKR